MRFIVPDVSALPASLLCQLIDQFGFDTSPVGEYHRATVLWDVQKAMLQILYL